jgi:hypothetical protein
MTLGEVNDLVARCVSHFDCQNIIHPPACVSGLPICMHHHYMCIVMEIVLQCSLPPGAELLAILEDRQTRIFRSRIFYFLCEYQCSTGRVTAQLWLPQRIAYVSVSCSCYGPCEKL